MWDMGDAWRLLFALAGLERPLLVMIIWACIMGTASVAFGTVVASIELSASLFSISVSDSLPGLMISVVGSLKWGLLVPLPPCVADSCPLFCSPLVAGEGFVAAMMGTDFSIVWFRSREYQL
jgi:hypothetical protein